jgi:hypothetical protein
MEASRQHDASALQRERAASHHSPPPPPLASPTTHSPPTSRIKRERAASPTTHSHQIQEGCVTNAGTGTPREGHITRPPTTHHHHLSQAITKGTRHPPLTTATSLANKHEGYASSTTHHHHHLSQANAKGTRHPPPTTTTSRKQTRGVCLLSSVFLFLIYDIYI